jgi:Dynamin family
LTFPGTVIGSDQILQLLDQAITETSRLGRQDLAGRLTAQRDQVTSGAWHVLVAGEFKKGKSALVNALLGVPVCGTDAVAFTAVPTIIRYGAAPAAELVLDSGQRRRIDPAQAARYATEGAIGEEARLEAVEVELPRELLRGGLVLIDTPGIGGGFAAAAAASTMRAMSLADAVLVVSDASQEYTAAEVELLRRAAEICPRLLCVLTKVDFYPEWQRILEINKGHLRRAGLSVDILPVSSVLRDAALKSGDQPLNAESGFPTLVNRLRAQLAAQREEVSATRAAEAVHSSLAQVAGTLNVEHTALTRPEEQAANLQRLDQAQEQAQQLRTPDARWQHVINDRFADVQSKADEDLQARIRRLEQEANERIRSGDPSREWAEIVPWLYQRTNEQLTDAHAQMMAHINDVAEEVGRLFDGEVAAFAHLTAGAIQRPTAGDAFRLDQLSIRNPGKLELGMHAARGWSLSSSVITTLVVATLHPGFLVVLPITAALGTVFAIKAVHGFKTARVEAARNEALRSVAGYLNQARVDANRAAQNILRHSRAQLRDFYLDRATELMMTAQAEQAAAVRAAQVDRHSAQQQASQTATDLARVTSLLDEAGRAVGARPGRPR